MPELTVTGNWSVRPSIKKKRSWKASSAITQSSTFWEREKNQQMKVLNMTEKWVPTGTWQWQVSAKAWHHEAEKSEVFEMALLLFSYIYLKWLSVMCSTKSLGITPTSDPHLAAPQHWCHVLMKEFFVKIARSLFRCFSSIATWIAHKLHYSYKCHAKIKTHSFVPRGSSCHFSSSLSPFLAPSLPRFLASSLLRAHLERTWNVCKAFN